jgi:hypothetical protein
MRAKLLFGLFLIVLLVAAFVGGLCVEHQFSPLSAIGLQPPKLLGPDDGAVLKADSPDMWKFTWSAVPNAEKYEIYIFHQGLNSSLVDSQVETPVFRLMNPHLMPSQLAKGWNWRVRVHVNGRWSKWSEVRTFDVDASG